MRQFQDSHSAGRAALMRLPQALAATGYADFAASYVGLGFSVTRAVEGRALAPPAMRPVIDLFMLGQEVAEDSLPSEIGALIEGLAELGLVTIGGGAVVSTGLTLLPVLGRWLFSQQLLPSPSVYFGDDSLALVQRLSPPPGGLVLDLCSGPGIQALHCAGFARHVDMVDINPAASAVARINVAMNGLESTITAHVGDLYEPVEGRRYDLLVANPPLIPLPGNMQFPFVGHGGPDGFRVTRRIIAGLEKHLALAGTAQIIGTSLSDGLRAQVVELLEQCLPPDLDAIVTITGHLPCRPGDWQFELLVGTGNSGGDPDQGAREKYASLLAIDDSTHLAYYFLRITHGSGRVSVMDLSRDEGIQRLWYV